jgi:hypothetical protein
MITFMLFLAFFLLSGMELSRKWMVALERDTASVRYVRSLEIKTVQKQEKKKIDYGRLLNANKMSKDG